MEGHSQEGELKEKLQEWHKAEQKNIVVSSNFIRFFQVGQ